MNGNVIRFFVKDDFSEMQVILEETVNSDWCNRYVNKWQTPKVYRLACHKFNKCVEDKFVEIVAPVWMKARREWIVSHEVIWGTIVAKANRLSGNNFDDIRAGDIVLIAGKIDPLWWTVCWQYRIVARPDPQWGMIMWAPWLWLLTDFTVTTKNWQTQYNFSGSWNKIEERVEIRVFSKLGNTVAYATADGIYYLHENQTYNKDVSCDVVNGNDTPVCQTVDARYPITWMCKYNDWSLALLTWWSVFYGQGWQNLFNFNYQIPVGDGYRHLLAINHYIILLGPESMKISYTSALDASWTAIPRVVDLTDDFWYFCPGSYMKYSRDSTDQFILGNSYGEIKKYDVEPFDNWLGTVKFKLNSYEIWGKFITTDLRSLSRINWDRMNISESEDWFRIFIRRWDPGNEANSRSMIIQYNERYKFFHKWILCGVVIRDERYGRWFWDKVYFNEWDTDNWHPIKQYISYKFGDQTFGYYKQVFNHGIKFLGRSLISKEVKLQISKYFWWYIQVEVEDKFWNAPYIRDINMMNLAKKYTKDDVKMVEDKFWIPLFTGKWMGTIDQKIWESKDFLKAFCDYTIDSKCGQDLEVQLENTNKWYLAKAHNVKTPINDAALIFIFELMGGWNDRIALWWFNLLWIFKDPKLHDIENTIWQGLCADT